MNRSAGRAASRLRYASQLWQQYVAEDPLPQLDRWLAAAMRNYPQFGRKDRRAYREILFAGARYAYLAVFVDFVRQQDQRDSVSDEMLAAQLEMFADHFGGPEAVVSALRLLPAELLFRSVGRRYRREVNADWPLAELEPDADEPWVDQLLEALLRLQAADILPARLLWQGIPLWLTASLATRVSRSNWSSAERDAFLAAQARQPPLWLRLNQAEHKVRVLRELIEHGLDASSQDDVIRVDGERSILGLSIWRDGIVEIQDWASQQIGRAVAVAPGERVWDACAGGGGKTVQLATALAGTGELYASDIRGHKLEEAARRVHRAGAGMIRTFVWHGDGPPGLADAGDRQAGFDKVLVDAPCSSSGTWRRSPDAKLRTTAVNVAAMQALQLQLLTHAAAAVKLAGKLVYSTCSWLVEENEAVVERFLANNPAFQLDGAVLHGCPAVDSDTMFSATMTKLSGDARKP